MNFTFATLGRIVGALGWSPLTIDRATLRSDAGTITGNADAPEGAVDLLPSITDGRQRVVSVRAVRGPSAASRCVS